MSQENNGLIDIVEPVAPTLAASANGYWIALLISGIGILLLGLFVIWKYKLPAYRSIQRVRALKRMLLSGENSPHETLLMLALELRHGLGLKRLRAENLPDRCKTRDNTRWPEFMRHLDELLYQHDIDLNNEKMAALFVEVEYWLSRYSRKSKLKKLDA